MKIKNRKSGRIYNVLVFNKDKIIIEIIDVKGRKRTQWIDISYVPKKWEVIK